jgi:hypothetical protein
VLKSEHRNNWISLVVAVIGFAIIGYVMINPHTTAKIMGAIWLSAAWRYSIQRAARRSELRSA